MKKGLDGVEERVRADLEELREEYERGMRFVHVISMQIKQDLYDTVTQMSAFIDAAAENGVVEREDLEKRYESSRQREYERIRGHAVVQIAEPNAATPVVTGDALDCQSRLHLCKARCCTFDVTLSTEDLDKGIIRWDYGRPYKLKSRADGYCVHSCGGDGVGCSAYDDRPAACKTYDCRQDERIWIDFDQRIPAPETAS